MNSTIFALEIVSGLGMFDKNTVDKNAFDRNAFDRKSFDACDITQMYNHLVGKTDEMFKNKIDKSINKNYNKDFLQCPDFDESDNDDCYV